MRFLGANDLNLLEALFGDLESSPFYVKDASLRYRAANRAMAQLCGASSSARLIGKKAADFYPATDAQRYENTETIVLRTGQPSATMIDFVSGSEPAWLVFSNHPLFDQNGTTVGVAGTSMRLARREFKDPVYRRVLAASAILKADIAAPLDLASTAAAAGVSIAQLQRDFSKIFKMSVRRFISQLRLTKARQLLLTDCSIAEIAHEIGFSDHSAFSRRFRDEYGITPTAFRKGRQSE